MHFAVRHSGPQPARRALRSSRHASTRIAGDMERVHQGALQANQDSMGNGVQRRHQPTGAFQQAAAGYDSKEKNRRAKAVT